MQLRPVIAACIYLGSYLPLSLILLVQDINFEVVNFSPCLALMDYENKCAFPLKNASIAISFFALCLFCFCVTLFTLTVIRTKQEVQIIECKHIPADLMNYVLPYVVSFMALDYNDFSKFVGFLIFLSWIFVISYKSGTIILNPLLIVFGWKLHEIKYRFTDSKSIYATAAFSKDDIAPSGTYRQQSIQDVMIIK